MMYKQFHYVANVEDDLKFRAFLKTLRLFVLPHQPGGPTDPMDTSTDRRRLLSLRPIDEVSPDPNPYPHYSAAAEPLIEWNIPLLKDKLIVTGYVRHHPYTITRGPDFAHISRVYSKIKKWMKTNWRPDGIGLYVSPGATDLLQNEGYTWSCFEPGITVTVVASDGASREITADEWMRD